MANNISNNLKNGLAALIFNNAAITGIGDANGLLPSAAAGSLYISLHTASPGQGGAQNTNEVTNAGYTRIAVVRSNVGWTVSGANVQNAADIVFPEATAGSSTVTHIGIGTASSGAGKLLYLIPTTQGYSLTAGVALKLVANIINITVE